MNSNDFKRINPYLYEIPASYRADMRAPARFYADAELLRAAYERIVERADLFDTFVGGTGS